MSAGTAPLERAAFWQAIRAGVFYCLSYQRLLQQNLP
jgi:hypothetical protein